MSSENVTLLVRKSKKGDASSFGKLYALYKNEMYSFAYYYLCDAHCAEDAVSDATLKAFQSISTIKNPKAFKSWLFTILIRSCQKQMKYVIDLRKSVDIDSLTDIENKDIHTQLNIELKDAVSLLDETDRQILLLSVISGYKSNEIGEMLSMPAGTVRSKLSRCTEKLYSMLNERSE